jgi:hypothetical protein
MAQAALADEKVIASLVAKTPKGDRSRGGLANVVV